MSDGQSLEDAVVIRADNTSAGIRLEYEWITERFGRRGIDWELVMQALIFHDNRPFDRMLIKLADGTERQIYFDIASFFGKF